MNDEFVSIKKGLENAIDHASGKKHTVRLYKPEKVNVKLLRKKISMTQPEFAATFGISLGTLRHWERGDREPRGPALILLNVISANPNAVLKALKFQ